MENDLALLPICWMNDGDAILVRQCVYEKCGLQKNNDIAIIYDSASQEGNICKIAHNYNELRELTGKDFEPHPWGWSKNIAERFRKFGIKENLIPNDSWLDKLRLASSREFGCKYIKYLIEEIQKTSYADCFVGHDMAFFLNVEDTVSHITNNICDSFILKSPWSSSGRGLYISADGITNKASDFIKTTIKSQGGITIDKFYRKSLDFALEYFIDKDGKAEFLGFSVFFASENGKYNYNIVDKDNSLRSIIEETFPKTDVLDMLIIYNRYKLEEMLGGFYHGEVGIDMIIADVNGEKKIHPCIEINLRMNMGIISMMIQQRINKFTQSTERALITGKDKNGFGAYLENGRFSIEYNK